MLETFNWTRGSGKTNKVTEEMEKDESLFLLIPINSMKKFYPQHLHNRIETFEQLLFGQLAGRRISKVILDEGFMLDKERLAHLYYILGFKRIDVISYGTV